MKYISLSLCFLFTAFCFGQTIPDSLRYLGNKTPDAEPIEFNLPLTPGYYAAERIAVSTDGKEIYYGELTGYGPGSKGSLRYMKYSEGKWYGPFTIIERASNMALSIDEKKLFVGAEWYCERTAHGWGNPQKFWNTKNKLHYIQETNSGTYYTFSYPDGDTIRRKWCKLLITKTDTTAESLGTPPNVSDPLMDFYIARDETYIILIMRQSSQNGNNGTPGLFISFRNKDKTWTNPKSLGSTINIPDPSEGRWGPYVTNDNKYLFYSHGKDAATTGIRWVRFDNLLESLRNTSGIK